MKKDEECVQRLVSMVKAKSLSQSHNVDHLERVAEYCRELAKMYGARIEVVTAAAWVHDLARIDKRFRGGESAEQGAKLAKPLLEKAGFDKKTIEQIVRCVAEHDQPDFHSKLLEARILKDADFLDGFGAWGMVRSIMYSAEVGEGVEGAVERMRVKMKRRLEGLEFVESRRMGWRRYRLVEMVLSQLEGGVLLEEVSYSGKLIVLEGISGSGKDTQADMLAEWMRKVGHEAVRVNHPTGEFKEKIWKAWRQMADDRQSELMMIAADRVRMVKQVMIEALREGKVVISTRSGISASVYQKVEGVDESWHRLLFEFEPMADLVVYLDIEPREALERTDERVRMGKEKNRGFFGDMQEEMRKRYEWQLGKYPNVVKVGGSGQAEEVFERVKKVVEKSGVV